MRHRAPGPAGGGARHGTPEPVSGRAAGVSAATVVTCTALAVFCFAANSLLCLVALAGGAI